IPALARSLFAQLGAEFAATEARLKQINAELLDWHRQDEVSRRLAQIPGVGPIGATMLALKAPDPGNFRSARHFAAWIGLTPRDHSTGGKTRLRGITRAGDEALRSLLVVGARRWFGKCGVTGDGHGLGCNAFWSASHRSWSRWRSPTRYM